MEGGGRGKSFRKTCGVFCESWRWRLLGQILKWGRRSKLKRERAIIIFGNKMTPAGLEPAIPGSVGRCLIHWATGPDDNDFQQSNSASIKGSTKLSQAPRKALVVNAYLMSGVAQWLACWAHNPKVRGSIPRSATFAFGHVLRTVSGR